MSPRAYSIAILAVLGVMAALLVALALGVGIPRVAFAGLILIQGGLRVARDYPRATARNRSLVQFAISAVLAALIVAS